MAHPPRPWSHAEDTLLKHAVADLGDTPGIWKTVASRVPGRSNKACRKRWLHSLSPTVRKVPWTPDEDALLLSLYGTHSPPRWSLIAKHIPGRTDDACSKRYREALDPQLKKDQWTDGEDATLLELTTQLGSKWTQVGQAMGRSGLGCRNRWRLLERKRSRSSPTPDAPYTHMTTPCTPIAIFHSGGPSGTPGNASAAIPSSSLIHAPHPSTISTASSLSHALAPVAPIPVEPPPRCAWMDPDLVTGPLAPVAEAETAPEGAIPASPDWAPAPSSPPDTHFADSPQQAPAEARAKLPRSGARHGGEEAPDYDQHHPRLSYHLPANEDRTVFPYACGHALCWPGASGHGSSRFATASEVGEHRRVAHADAGAGEKAFRCALEGCGKGWKNINGIQYHLQISKAHFKAALSQSRASDGETGPGTARKEHRCPHDGCGNTYKQRTGLHYHLAHGHLIPVAQLDVIPPGLKRKIAHASSP